MLRFLNGTRIFSPFINQPIINQPIPQTPILPCIGIYLVKLEGNIIHLPRCLFYYPLNLALSKDTPQSNALAPRLIIRFR